MYLIYDAAANGKPKTWKAEMSDTFNWPRLVHLSWIVLDEEFKPISDHDYVVKPKGFTLDEEAMKKCHLDQEDIDNKATELDEILEKFAFNLDKAKFIFCHNQNYNENVVGAEYYRANKRNPFIALNSFCLMREATWYCKLKGKGPGYKWPSLNELHAILFRQKYTPSNNARADVIAASRCFIMLMKKGELEDCFDLDDE